MTGSLILLFGKHPKQDMKIDNRLHWKLDSVFIGVDKKAQKLTICSK